MRLFVYRDINNRLNSDLILCEIIELAYLFVIDIPLKQAVTLTGRSSTTVTDWYNMCREVCFNVIAKKPPLAGTFENPIQIDEASFAGR